MYAALPPRYDTLNFHRSIQGWFWSLEREKSSPCPLERDELDRKISSEFGSSWLGSLDAQLQYLSHERERERKRGHDYETGTGS